MEPTASQSEPGQTDLDRAMVTAVRVRMAEVGIKSQAALSRASGVPEGTMKPRWEGKRGFGLDLLEPLARALNLPVADLVERAENIRRGGSGGFNPLRGGPPPR